jgi:hypothetical protein
MYDRRQNKVAKRVPSFVGRDSFSLIEVLKMKIIYLLSLITIYCLASVPAEAYPHMYYTRPHITRMGRFVTGHYNTRLYNNSYYRYRRTGHFW